MVDACPQTGKKVSSILTIEQLKRLK